MGGKNPAVPRMIICKVCMALAPSLSLACCPQTPLVLAKPRETNGCAPQTLGHGLFSSPCAPLISWMAFKSGPPAPPFCLMAVVAVLHFLTTTKELFCHSQSSPRDACLHPRERCCSHQLSPLAPCTNISGLLSTQYGPSVGSFTPSASSGTSLLRLVYKSGEGTEGTE